MNEAAGKDLAGLDRMEARKVAVAKLKEIGSWVKEDPYDNSVGYSERADVPIEPRLSEQWFLKYPSQEKSRAVAATGELKFYPERWAKVYDHWLANIQDWCISRQLWWGHRIPVWYRGDEIKCQIESPGAEWVQDTDVLDTWFSSWLWPFATMDKTTLAKFYPTTALVTAPEILFFWVARMIMAGYEYTGQKPFNDVYLTGIVRDKKGDKMSKSKGNSPDPLVLIAKFGADALRFGVMRSAPLGQDLLYDEQHVELGRNFCNKLWNACRFRQMQGGQVEGEIDPALLGSDDKWILLKLDAAIRQIDAAFVEYRFNEVAQVLYRFFWNEYCDWYVEASKSVFYGQDDARKANTLAVIDFVLSHMLRLFHPFLPFITEELWHGMGYDQELPEAQGGKTLMQAVWPKPLNKEFKDHYSLDESDEKFVDAKYELITQGRNLRREGNLASHQKFRFIFKPANAMPAHEVEVIKLLLNAEPLDIDPNFQPAKGTPTARSPLGELYLPLEGLIDIAAEKARLAKSLEKIKGEIEHIERRLNNPAFAEKAPAAVLEDNRARLADWKAKEAHAVAALDALK
jgi:valyl-tRNA synthetase